MTPCNAISTVRLSAGSAQCLKWCCPSVVVYYDFFSGELASERSSCYVTVIKYCSYRCIHIFCFTIQNSTVGIIS